MTSQFSLHDELWMYKSDSDSFFRPVYDIAIKGYKRMDCAGVALLRRNWSQTYYTQIPYTNYACAHNS